MEFKMYIKTLANGAAYNNNARDEVENGGEKTCFICIIVYYCARERI